MTHRDAFAAGVARLSSAAHPTETPELDARVLLGHVLGLGHAALLSRWNEPLDEAAAPRWERALQRRVEGEPVAWITGFKEFAGLEFETPPGLLVPRADTETLVDAALEVLSAAEGRGNGTPRVLDVCAGTGCVAVALAARAPAPLEVWAGDVSELAVTTTERNAARLLSGERTVTAVRSDLLEHLPGAWSLVVSNPPYLTGEETRERVETWGWREPALALNGGESGLELPFRLIDQAAGALAPGGWLLLEAAGPQMPALAERLGRRGLREVRVWKDLAGIDRVIGGVSVGREP